MVFFIIIASGAPSASSSKASDSGVQRHGAVTEDVGHGAFVLSNADEHDDDSGNQQRKYQ